MRSLTLMLAIAVASPAVSAERAPYYGPVKPLRLSLDNGLGVSERVRRDGSWAISAEAVGPHALDLALYRAAEKAQAAGYPYVQLLRGYAARNWLRDLATVYARPSDSPAPPADCWKRRRNSCYTADAADVMRRLGGTDGRAPGVPIADHRDARGREVARHGYGTGMVSGAAFRTVPQPAALTVGPAPAPAPFFQRSGWAGGDAQAAADRYDAALRAARPVRGDARLGWTASR